MSHFTKNMQCCVTRMLPVLVVAVTLLLATGAQAAVPGITGTSFALTAGPTFMTQPDGQMIYSWGYGCSAPVAASGFAPAGFPGANCPLAQIPGPTLIVTEGATVIVTLTNNLPAAAGNTSILFPGFTVTPTGGVTGLLTQEAAHNLTVTYTFDTTGKAGTHAYYSGTQTDLQVEMGLSGALVVIPAATPAAVIGVPPCRALGAQGSDDDFRLATSAYDHAATCYDREYLFQWAEVDQNIHRKVEEQVPPLCTSCPATITVATEPYHPAYFVINGRSMPDDMDSNYAPNYPNQPYNGNPHMHPGELVLLRVIGQGHMQHPFHEHGEHTRILGRDGNLLVSQTNAAKLAGRLEFTTDTTPGQAFDGIFEYTGRGLNWDVYGHTPVNNLTGVADPLNPVCMPDANGFYTEPAATRPGYVGGVMTTGSANYYEWCADHNHPLEAFPGGQVGQGGPMTLPDPNILANGLWYNGTPYLGPDAVSRSVGNTPLPPSGTLNNPPAESGIAFMWHSHNEREITTNDIFPGGMMMMMLVDPWVWFIDEAK